MSPKGRTGGEGEVVVELAFHDFVAVVLAAASVQLQIESEYCR